MTLIFFYFFWGLCPQTPKAKKTYCTSQPPLEAPAVPYKRLFLPTPFTLFLFCSVNSRKTHLKLKRNRQRGGSQENWSETQDYYRRGTKCDNTARGCAMNHRETSEANFFHPPTQSRL